MLYLLCRFTTPSSSAITMPTKTQQPISVSAGAGTAPTAVQPAEAKKTKGERVVDLHLALMQPASTGQLCQSCCIQYCAGGEAFTLNTSSKDPKSVTKAKESISKRMSAKKGGATGAKKSAAKASLTCTAGSPGV